MGELKVKLMFKDAVLPTRGTERSVGLDLYSPIDFTIPPCTAYGRAVELGRYTVDTGVAIGLKPEQVAFVKPRSGLGFNRKVDVFEGTIDEDYRGSIKVLLYNTSHQPIDIKKGDRIAQLIIQKFEKEEPVKVKSLDDTARGTGGLGSTGN